VKNCTRCGQLLPLDDFYFVSRKLGTRRGECKPCMAEVKRAQKDPNWKPTCSACGKERDRVGPGRRLCKPCFDAKYDTEDRCENGSHRLRLKPCSACGATRLREDHVKGSSLCPICRSVPQGRRKRLRDFNMTPRMYVTLLEEQDRCCWICERPFTKRLIPHVDHRHASPMIVRGLLCGTCNTILGLAKDSADRLLGAAKYLETPPAQMFYPGLEAFPEANRRNETFVPLRREAA